MPTVILCDLPSGRHLNIDRLCDSWCWNSFRFRKSGLREIFDSSRVIQNLFVLCCKIYYHAISCQYRATLNPNLTYLICCSSGIDIKDVPEITHAQWLDDESQFFQELLPLLLQNEAYDDVSILPRLQIKTSLQTERYLQIK
jgi:hypothetical protein